MSITLHTFYFRFMQFVFTFHIKFNLFISLPLATT